MARVRRQGRACVLAILGTLLCGSGARASDVVWNGFFSTGASFSDHAETYHRGITRKPDVTGETVLGLNLTKQVSSKVDVAAQFLAQENNADSAVKADWAFVSFTPQDGLEVVVGKQKMPMWMVSQYFDVGALFPWPHPPEEVYALLNLKSFTGLAVNYGLKLGPSTLVITPYGGEALIEGAPNAPTLDSKIKATNLCGGEIQWRLAKTTLRAGFSRANWDLDIGPLFQLGQRRFDLWSYGLTTGKGGLVLMAEYAATRDLSAGKYRTLADEEEAQAAAAAAAGDGAAAGSLATQAILHRVQVGGHRGYYVTTGYQLAPVGVYLTYADLDKRLLPNLSNSQKSAALGVNFDLTHESVLKFEAKRLAITGDSVGLFSVPFGATPDLDRAMIYSGTFNLIF